MRFLIIGRIFEDGKLAAYRIYEANKKETKIYKKEDVRSVVKRGILVVGLTVANDGRVVGVHESFNVSKTDILNGKGIPIEPSDRYVLVGLSGYAENRTYRLVNSKGYEKIVNREEFKELVEKNKVNGAKKSAKQKDKIIIYKHCNYREYN
ncbi:hypothetical protein JCM17380_13050 [Desulfosporosinus burensis]